MKNLLALLFMFTSIYPAYSQCIDTLIFSPDNSWTETYDHQSQCPIYVFAFKGDTSVNWNRARDPIHIGQAPKQTLTLKKYIDRFIREYSGKAFFSRVNFEDVYIAYPDSAIKFRSDGWTSEAKNCKAKYVFYYSYSVDSISKYRFGVTVDSRLKIIGKPLFPSKENYRKPDSTFTYCKLLDIVKKLKPDFGKIDEIILGYSRSTQRFVWRIMGKIPPVKGASIVYWVEVDASRIANQTLKSGQLWIEE